MKAKGFTLIEVLVTTLIAGIIGGGLTSVIYTSNKVLNRSVLEANMQSNGMRILETIGNDVKRGIVLESTSETSLDIKDTTGVVTNYTFSNDKLFKDSKEVIITGAESYALKGNFKIDVVSRYYAVDVQLNIILKSSDIGGQYQTDSLNNIYYCRFDPEGWGL